jgi:predicted pyridoxine 5'-phosphate oxidase superfamily flavin-nucleotide-binding protein
VLIEQHRQFYVQLPFILVGSVDATGQPWASMLAGHPGFVHSPDVKHLRFDVAPVDGDPVNHGLAVGAPLGVLGIQPSTRRRNRISGRISAIDERGFTVEIVQSYGNCPQYIQSRVLYFRQPLEGRHEIIRADRLSQDDWALLERSDTFYIATVNPNPADGVASGADVSHRGGRPGFVRVNDRQTITTPDFVGNFMFNTLGNLIVEPRAGLLFADFETGDLLFAAARAEIIWEGPEVKAFAAAQRLMRFHLTKVIRLPGALPFRAKPDVEYARELAATGTWAEAEHALL